MTSKEPNQERLMTTQKTEGAKYRIQSLEDFLAVPEEEQDECLLQFGEWLRNVRKSAKACNARVRWQLKDYTDAERDEFLGGLIVCVPKRFLFRSKFPKAVAQDKGLPPRSDLKSKLRIPAANR